MAEKKTKLKMSDVLRAAIRDSGLSAYRISVDSGLVVSSIIRFINGETSLRLDKADVLAEYLGLELVVDPTAKPPEPTPDERARPMLAGPRAKRKLKRRLN